MLIARYSASSGRSNFFPSPTCFTAESYEPARPRADKHIRGGENWKIKKNTSGEGEWEGVEACLSSKEKREWSKLQRNSPELVTVSSQISSTRCIQRNLQIRILHLQQLGCKISWGGSSRRRSEPFKGPVSYLFSSLYFFNSRHQWRSLGWLIVQQTLQISRKQQI